MSDLFSFLGRPPIQDYVQIGPLTSPGACSIVRAGSPRKWDIRQGYGLSGAALYYAGDQASKFDVIITLWEDEHWAEWSAFAKVLARAPKGTRPLALPIKHPILTCPPLAITSIVIEDVSQPILSEFGDWDIVISCIEWRAPLPVLGKVIAAVPAVPHPPPVARDVGDQMIDKLLQNFSALAGP